MSALYLRLKQRKVFKIVKGGPFGLFETSVCCQMSKNLKAGPFGETKIFEKSHSAQKNEKGYPLVSSGFVCNVRKGKIKGGPFALSYIRFRGIRWGFGGICSVEQTEQKFPRFESVVKKKNEWLQ